MRGGQEADAVQAARRHHALIIVDYAETRPQKNMARLLWQLAWPDDRPGRPSLIVARGVQGQSDTPSEKLRKRSVRVLLTARAAGDWWGNMHNEAQTIRERHIIRQAKLVVLKSINSRSDTIQQHYNAAIDAFADVLNFTTKPDHKRFLTADVNINLSILVIHVAALVALLDVNQIATERQDQVMGRLLEHEDRYWQRTAPGLPT